ncbi:MAG: ABC transporter ATP-binding protein [Desulfobacterales bacterium]|jgi:multiple sugar transport system ATP-binding protein
MAEIITKNLNKKFNDFVAVSDTNLTIKDGEFFVLLGPSGCGKTTTLRMIAGLEFPTSGNIFLDSEDVTFRRASQRDIAFVFQLFALYPHMNVEKNIGYPLKTQRVARSEIKRRVREVAKLLHLEHILKSKVSGLSGGDRQRVALGRAIIRRPKAFLMDEPLGALDAEFRELMCSELKKLHTDIEATTIYVTHDQNEAMAMGDRVGVMDKGQILQADDPLTLYNKPRTMFVANFIGSPAMNFLPIHASIQKGCTSVSINGYLLNIPELHEPGHSDLNYVGVRPENIEILDANQEGFQGKVYGVEYLGVRKIITVDTAVGRVKVRSANNLDVKLDDNVKLNFNSKKIIIYNSDNGKAIKSEFVS